MARMRGIDPHEAEPAIAAVLESQTRIWGAPLLPFLCYARRPTIFRAVRGMWAGIEASGMIDG
ncbi:MAG: hypothetical protein ACRDV9_05635, partial [Acidimicrobiia bacterium]